METEGGRLPQGSTPGRELINSSRLQTQ